MGRDNSIKKLLTILEPLVWDIYDQNKILSDKKEELESVSRFIAYTKDNHEMVGIYSDQDIIISKFDKLGININDYKASCYLLKSDDEYVRKLPQYDQAIGMIESIIDYFVQYKGELTSEIQELNIRCQRKEIEKKYYDILSSTNPFIENVDEFKSIINGYDLSNQDKISILIYIIKNNIKNYETGNK